MDEAFKLAAAIITGLGGGGAIVWALSSWIGKVWANRILEDEKEKHTKEIENYKSELNKELKRVSAIQEKALHISKAQYDNEYKIYQEIWEKMHECILFTKMLYVEGENDLTESYQREKHNIYQNAFRSYLLIIDQYAPFYKKEFYDLFIEVRDKCVEIGRMFCKYELAMAKDTRMTNDEREKVYSTFHTEIDEIKNELQIEIREYLLSLQLVE